MRKIKIKQDKADLGLRINIQNKDEIFFTSEFRSPSATSAKTQFHRNVLRLIHPFVISIIENYYVKNPPSI